MYCSCLKLYRILLVLILLCGCAAERMDPVEAAPVGSGFSLKLASRPEIQASSLLIAGEEVPLDIRMHADTGVTFGASFFKIPETLHHLKEQEKADTLWSFFSQRLQAEPVPHHTAIAEGQRYAHGAWFRSENGSTAMVVMVNGDRAVAAFAGIMPGSEGPAAERKVMGYMDSLRPEHGP
jgi:hypothetical protein